MIRIPDSYKEKIINRYKDDGKKWLNNIDGIIKKYVKMFNLKNVKTLNDLTMNIILEANSDRYGKVIVKIGTPGITSFNEIKYINLLKLNSMVKCYYYNENDRVMILEKISPGYSLNEVNSIDERIEIFCNMVNEISENSKYLELFPTYDEKLKNKINEIKEDKYVDIEIRKMLDIAIKMYNEISDMNLPKFVLHNDLQHINILKDYNGWKFIDPHGIVGERIFETCQFIKAEISDNLNDMEKLNIIVEKIAKNLNENVELIYKALYIENITKIFFYIKSGDNEIKILNNIDFCKNLLKYIYIEKDKNRQYSI